jgi:hypothetical protein
MAGFGLEQPHARSKELYQLHSRSLLTYRIMVITLDIEGSGDEEDSSDDEKNPLGDASSVVEPRPEYPRKFSETYQLLSLT